MRKIKNSTKLESCNEQRKTEHTETEGTNDREEVKKIMGKANLTEESVYQSTFPGYPDVVDVEDLCGMLGISSVTAYKLLKGGKIEHLRIGRKYKIPKIHVLRYLGLVA